MQRNWTMALSGLQHEKLYNHLHPGDGLEAAAILLCRLETNGRNRLLVYDAIFAPHGKSKRSEAYLTWPGEVLSNAIDRAEDESASLILVHSHPGAFLEFSEIDNESDLKIFPFIFDGWTETSPIAYHGSAIMTPDGAMRARLYDKRQHMQDIDLVTVSGDDIKYFWVNEIVQGKVAPKVQPFFEGMADKLGRLSAGIVGASGTGSILAEQAARMGFGEIVLIDFDIVEHKNLNRILNSTIDDADQLTLKVDMLKNAIKKYRPDCLVHSVPRSIADRKAVLEAARCDVLFCCVDTFEGRHILDLLAQAMILPLFDVGVTIPTRAMKDGEVVVAEAFGRIDYIQPGSSSLFSREVYSAEALRAEYLAIADPEAHRKEALEGYIKGVTQEAPSVIALNMRAAAACMLEFIARAFPYRHEANANYARTIFSLASAEEDNFTESSFDPEQNYIFANGLRDPLLGMPALSE